MVCVGLDPNFRWKDSDGFRLELVFSNHFTSVAHYLYVVLEDRVDFYRLYITQKLDLVSRSEVLHSSEVEFQFLKH